MIEIKFSDTEISKLKRLHVYHPHHVVRHRALILILKSENIPHHKIATIADVCENTVRDCFLAYKEGGIKKLITLNFSCLSG